MNTISEIRKSFGTFHGPIPARIDKLCEEKGHPEANRELYLAGHLMYHPYWDCMVPTQRGRNYHVALLIGNK